MKTKVINILWLAFYHSVGGCSEVLLDQTPQTQNVINNYFKDAAQLRKGVNSAYGILQASGSYKLAKFGFGLELPSDNTWDEVPANDNGNYGQLDLFSMTSALIL